MDRSTKYLLALSLALPIVVSLLGFVTGFGVAIVYFEHLVIADTLGIRVPLADGFMPVPILNWLLVLTAVVDFVLMVIVTYVALRVGKWLFVDRPARIR